MDRSTSSNTLEAGARDTVDMTDVIDQLNEARLFCEAAYLAASGMQLRQEAAAMQQVIGAACDQLKDALGKLDAPHRDIDK